MKCPQCGADTSVISTRDAKRGRACFNGHRFTTTEMSKVELGRLLADSLRLARLRRLVNEEAS